MKSEKKERVLLLSGTASMLEQFNRNNIRILREQSYDVDIACNFRFGNTEPPEQVCAFQKEMEVLGVQCYQIDFPRGAGTPRSDYRAFRQIQALLNRREYAFVHCHTPTAAAIGRLACFCAGVTVVYTCHGFQFFHGGRRRDWLFFYPLESLLSRRTHTLITVNRDDYRIASGHFHARYTCYIPGVGIDWKRYACCARTKEDCRDALSIPRDAFVLLSVGELNDRKNHGAVIRAMALLKDSGCQYYIAGIGTRETARQELMNLAKSLGVGGQVHLIGYRTDLEYWYKAADVAFLLSKREGFGMAGLEAMASGLPLVTTGTGGISDYFRDQENGFLCRAEDYEKLSHIIARLESDPALREQMGKRGREIAREYDSSRVDERMWRIYEGLREKEAGSSVLS
ncbi:MAG: glycosyltransferase family 4 protein [Lachnospiraceae bacterium]|nr:glycosyltransferase family 4 protein [Lachnospiraceae bacterium]